MSHRLPDVIQDIADQTDLDERARAALESQSWYRKYANTVNVVVGAVVTGAASLVSAGIELPEWTTVTVATVGVVGTILGVYKTKNGLPADVADRLK